MKRVTNKAIIEYAFAFASEQLRFRGTPVLIPLHPGAGDGDRGRLPGIMCIGEFISARPARNASHMFSSSTLIWFRKRLLHSPSRCSQKRGSWKGTVSVKTGAANRSMGGFASSGGPA